MQRNENESFEKYQERRKMDKQITKMQLKGKILGCTGCGKCNVTLKNIAGEYTCEKCTK